MTIIEQKLKNFSWHFSKKKNLKSWAKQNFSSNIIWNLFKMLSRNTYEFVHAAEYGAFSTVAKILEKNPKIIDAQTSAGWTATHKAAGYALIFL